MNNRASLQLGGGNWAAKDANLLAYKTSLSEKNFLPIEFDFTRGSNLAATRVDENGLIEKGRENIVLQSNNFDDDEIWAKSSSNVTSGQAGYDGTTDAWSVSKTAQYGRIEQTVTLAGLTTMNVYAKASTNDWIAMRHTADGSSIANFDLTNGVFGAIGSNVVATNSVSVGNGWYRVSVTWNYTGSSGIRIHPNASDNIGGTTATIFIQDVQVEQGLVATDYIETGATTVQAGVLEDLPRINYSGSTPSLLLEPPRTNLIANSEYANGGSVSSATITDNVTISPEGVQNAARFVPTAAFGRWQSATFGGSITNGTTYVTSMYFNTGSTLDIVTFYIGWNGATGADRIGIKFNPSTRAYISTFAFGSATLTDYNISEADSNGWYRVSLIAPATNPNVSTQIVLRDFDSLANNSDFVDFYGWQMEQGSYPTSYIPTYGAAATRGSEASAFELELASFFNNVGVSGDATFMMGTSIVGRSSSFIDVFSQGGSGNNTYNSTTFGLRIDGGGGLANFSDLPDVLTILDSIKILIRKSGTTFNVFVNGTKSTSTQTIDISVTPIKWADHVSTYRNSQAVKQILKFPEALSDADCITLTTL